jgi:hypothetical protein
MVADFGPVLRGWSLLINPAMGSTGPSPFVFRRDADGATFDIDRSGVVRVTQALLDDSAVVLAIRAAGGAGVLTTEVGLTVRRIRSSIGRLWDPETGEAPTVDAVANDLGYDPSHIRRIADRHGGFKAIRAEVVARMSVLGARQGSG